LDPESTARWTLLSGYRDGVSDELGARELGCRDAKSTVQDDGVWSPNKPDSGLLLLGS
jgi:hypothetical protein